MNNCDYTHGLHPTRIERAPEIRRYVIQLLNYTLACTVDLRSYVKQAYWNVIVV
jgi:starvation-inducible DNA-binding protein